MWFNTSKDRQDAYYKQQEYQRLCDKARGEDRKTMLRAGLHDGEDNPKISLDALPPLPRCSNCGAKLKYKADKCEECGYTTGTD